MALSTVTYPTDGVTSEFTLSFALGYISEDHVSAWVRGEYNSDGSKSYRALTFISRERVRISGTVPPAGGYIEFARVLPKNKEIIEFNDGDSLNEDNLGTAQKQALMTSHEALDAVDVLSIDIRKDVQKALDRLREEMNGLADEVVFIFVEKEPGTDDRRDYVHTQSEESSTWTIDHNLNTYPGVAVYDHTGQQLVVEYSFSTRNQIRITFAQPERGVAYVH